MLARRWTRLALTIGGLVCGACSIARAGSFSDTSNFTLLAQQSPESIYAPPEPPRENEGVNEGGVHTELTVRYMSDYIFRGIDRSEVGGHEDAPNLQFDGKISFDLGKAPHPFIGAFVNVYDSDPISRFQEIRPTFGFDWPIKPLLLSMGNNTYIFPERDQQNTSEVFTRIEMDDSFLWGTTRPVLTPYVYGAYDYDLFKGWYLEAGVKHDFVFEDYGLTLTLLADVGYSLGEQQFADITGNGDDSGLQHYDLGLIGTYSLNNLFNVSRRYGEFSFQGYLFYTDGIEHELRADTQMWGGVGIYFRY